MPLVFHWAKAPQSWDRSITNSTHRLSRCALWGHGTAARPASLSLFEESERFGDAARLVQERLRRGDILPGFGHHSTCASWSRRAARGGPRTA